MIWEAYCRPATATDTWWFFLSGHLIYLFLRGCKDNFNKYNQKCFYDKRKNFGKSDCYIIYDYNLKWGRFNVDFPSMTFCYYILKPLFLLCHFCLMLSSCLWFYFSSPNQRDPPKPQPVWGDWLKRIPQNVCQVNHFKYCSSLASFLDDCFIQKITCIIL